MKTFDAVKWKLINPVHVSKSKVAASEIEHESVLVKPITSE